MYHLHQREKLAIEAQIVFIPGFKLLIFNVKLNIRTRFCSQPFKEVQFFVLLHWLKGVACSLPRLVLFEIRGCVLHSHILVACYFVIVQGHLRSVTYNKQIISRHVHKCPKSSKLLTHSSRKSCFYFLIKLLANVAGSTFTFMPQI